MTTAPPPSRPPPPAPTPDPVDGVDLDAFLTGARTARRRIARRTEAAVGGEGDAEGTLVAVGDAAPPLRDEVLLQLAAAWRGCPPGGRPVLARVLRRCLSAWGPSEGLEAPFEAWLAREGGEEGHQCRLVMHRAAWEAGRA